MTNSPGELDGRVALVTGAAGEGIGQAIARRLAEDGARVAVTDIHARRTREVAEKLAVDFPGRIVGYEFDVADRARADDVLARLSEEFGPVDILVNNAAENVLAPVSQYSDEDWDRGIAVNFTGCFYLTRRVLPAMMERRWGSIVNITSVAAWLSGGGREGPYASAKAALHSLTRAVAFEGGPHGVRCNAVAPGIIASKFVRKYQESFREEVDRTPLRRIGDPEEVAAAVAFLVSEQSSFITGEVLNVSGGWYMHA
jgi:NAD(P)-dependent dehydrogenase (short-subunit alcohol dehydrogenase family)